MPTIPFPNVPNYPGVPQIPRTGQNQPASGVTFGLGPTQPVLADSMQTQPQWGIFDAFGSQVGITSQDSILSTSSFEFLKEMKTSDFPVQRGGFASYNKVERPANPTVTLAFQGSVGDRATFLNAIDAAVKSTGLYSVITPEVTYANYSLDRYSYMRRSERGVTLLIVEIVLTEIRQVSAQYFTVQTPINDPQNPAAVEPTSQGTVQPQDPSSSVLKSFANWMQFPGGN